MDFKVRILPREFFRRSSTLKATSFKHLFFVLLLFICVTPSTLLVPLCLELNSNHWLLAMKGGDIAH